MISAPQKESDRFVFVQEKRSRFTADRGDFYFICVYFSKSYTWQPFYFIQHDAIEVYNEGSSSDWNIPLFLCQPGSFVSEPTPFNFYTHDNFTMPDATGNISGDLSIAFNVRLKLFRWFQMDKKWQNTHPLSPLEIKFASTSVHEKWLDSACYYLLLQHVSSDALSDWLRGEAQLLEHKLLLKPELASLLVKFLELPSDPHTTALHQAYSCADEYVAKNYERLKSVEFQHCSNAEFKELVHKCIASLESDKTKRKQDSERELLLKELANEAKQSVPPKLKEEADLFDTMACAPQCVKKLLHTAILGDTIQQASLTIQQRHKINQFLLVQDQIPSEIKTLMQPMIQIAYEMEENPQQTQAEINAGIDASYTAVVDRKETPQQYMNCSDMMEASMCPYTRANPSGFYSMNAAAQKSKRLEIFVCAKKQCHADLVKVFNAHKAAGRVYKSAESVKTAWTMSPHCFTQTALKGEKANTDKKESDERPTKKQRT